uniref:Uncharacterized protein n=1 Tax=Populus trichocarpa TaxID=3694 RepID=A9PC97_POPTR|nr:unknown [Populus trichocarpa]
MGCAFFYGVPFIFVFLFLMNYWCSKSCNSEHKFLDHFGILVLYAWSSELGLFHGL